MTPYHSLFLVFVIMGIGYGGLYGADNSRDPNREAVVFGIPVRFISLMIVAFGSVGILAFAITAPDLFLGDLPADDQLTVTLQAMSVASIFSVVGAVTTDSLFQS